MNGERFGQLRRAIVGRAARAKLEQVEACARHRGRALDGCFRW